MAARRGKRSARVSLFEPAFGGRTISPAAMRRAVAAVDSRDDTSKSIRERARLYGEAYKYRMDALKRLKKDNAPPSAVADLRRVVDEVAKRKVLAPAVAKAQSGLLAGHYSLRLAPGYDYGDIATSFSDVRNSAFVTRGSGEVGFKMLADQTRGLPFTDDFTHLPSRSVGVFARLGAFFIPLMAPAIVRVDVAPSLSFAWWTVSTGSPAWTFGQPSLWLLGFRFDGTLDTEVGGGNGWLWDQHTTDLEFDWGSPLYTHMFLVANTDSEHFYLVYIELAGLAQSFGTGAQASVAGGMLNCVLPYIDLDVQYIPPLRA